MRQIISIYFLLLAIGLLQAEMYRGEWINKLEQKDRVDHSRIRFYSEEKLYSKEGLVFAFPTNYFSVTPHIQITIELHNVHYSCELEFQPLVTEVSPLLAKINVNKVNTGLIQHFTTEAETDDIIVHVLAYGY